jgi:hypothetical protein
MVVVLITMLLVVRVVVNLFFVVFVEKGFMK